MKKLNRKKQLEKAINLAKKKNSRVLDVTGGLPLPGCFKMNDILCDFKTGETQEVIYIKPQQVK